MKVINDYNHKKPLSLCNKKKTINQVVYREDMCPQMFEDIDQVMQGEPWTWQQDGVKPHTAK